MCVRLNRLSVVLLWLLAGADSQRAPPPFYYHAWLVATPWRPLVPATLVDAQHLSLGYTGPQIFPGVAGQTATQISAVRKPVLLGLVRPGTREQFTLPFRPSPFAGYSDEAEEDQAQAQQAQQVELHQHLIQSEPPFHAPGYPQPSAPIAAPLVGQDQAEQLPDHHPVQRIHQHYIYMSPSHQYNLVRS